VWSGGFGARRRGSSNASAVVSGKRRGSPEEA
jgi:hypothetical protein